jgi:hypothetical protein
MAMIIRQSTSIDIPIGPFLANVPPPRAIGDSTNVPALESKIVCNALVSLARRCAPADLPNYVIGQDRGVMTLALRSPVRRHVSVVFGWRTPIQILRAVIHRVVVLVAALIPDRTRSDKRFEYNVVNVSLLTPAEPDHRTAVALAVFRADNPKFQLSPCVRKTPSVVLPAPHRAV